MANIDRTESKALLDASLTSTAYTEPSAWYVALIASSFTLTDTTPYGATANEVSAGSGRAAIAFPAATAGAPSTTTAPAVTFTTMPGAVTGGIEIYTASTGTARRLWYGNLSANKTTASGDTLTVTVTATLS